MAEKSAAVLKELVGMMTEEFGDLNALCFDGHHAGLGHRGLTRSDLHSHVFNQMKQPQ
jgi:hypothetical protein